MKLETNLFLTICQRDFPDIQIFMDPESFDEGYNRSSGLTNTLVEYLGMHRSSIAGGGQELDALVKMQGDNGLKLEGTSETGGKTKVQIFYITDTARQALAMIAMQAAIKEKLEIFSFNNAG